MIVSAVFGGLMVLVMIALFVASIGCFVAGMCYRMYERNGVALMILGAFFMWLLAFILILCQSI